MGARKKSDLGKDQSQWFLETSWERHGTNAKSYGLQFWMQVHPCGLGKGFGLVAQPCTSQLVECCFGRKQTQVAGHALEKAKSQKPVGFTFAHLLWTTGCSTTSCWLRAWSNLWGTVRKIRHLRKEVSPYILEMPWKRHSHKKTLARFGQASVSLCGLMALEKAKNALEKATI